jgi:hypothetical protein
MAMSLILGSLISLIYYSTIFTDEYSVWIIMKSGFDADDIVNNHV